MCPAKVVLLNDILHLMLCVIALHQHLLLLYIIIHMNKLKLLFISLCTITVPILLAFSIKIVPTGYIGIVTHYGKIHNSTPLKAGLNFVMPFIASVEKISTRLTKLDLKFDDIFAKDSQEVKLTISVQYSLLKSEVPSLYSQVGSQKSIENMLLTPIIRGEVQNTVTKYTTEEFITDRAQIQQKLTQSITEKLTRILIEKNLNKNALKIYNMEITGFNPSDMFKQLVKTKNQSKQKIIEAETEAKIKEISNLASANALIEEARAKAKKIELISAAKTNSMEKQTKVVLTSITEFLNNIPVYLALVIFSIYKSLIWIYKKLFHSN